MDRRFPSSPPSLGDRRGARRGGTRPRGHHCVSGGKEKVMRGRYLEVTFRKGRAIAAYLYLPRRGTERAARVSKASAGLLIDYDPQGKPIGIEITAAGRLSLTAPTRVLSPRRQARPSPA